MTTVLQQSSEGKTEISSYPSQREVQGGPRRQKQEEMPYKSRARKSWPTTVKLGKDFPLEKNWSPNTKNSMFIGQLWLYMAGHIARKLLKV